MYFCKTEMIEVDSKNQTKPNTSHKFLCLHPHPFAMRFCRCSHQEMRFSFYSLDLDLPRQLLWPLEHSQMGCSRGSNGVHALGLAVFCYFWEPEMSMQRTWTCLVEGYRQHEADTCCPPSSRHVIAAIPDQPAAAERPDNRDRLSQTRTQRTRG